MYSIISHELRSPLSLLLGHAEQLAMDEDLPEEAAERVNALRGEVVRMSRLLGRLQEDAVSDGLDDIISESVDMNEIVGQVLSYSAQQYPDYQVEYSGTEEPAIVMGDEVRLLQVISNLLDNAVKYSRQDHNMKIRLRRDKQDLILSVADRGIGIPEDLREKVFDRFYRVDNELTREESGQGFGLSLARTIVEAHKGRIWIDWTDSQNKIGATLNVALPAEPEAI
jgi:signal transduction histidine kinase